MKSLVKAINNLANSISKLADSKKTVISKPVPQTTTSNPYAGSVTVTPAYVSKDTEGWYTLSAAEKEQLYYIYKAIIQKNINPKYINADSTYDKVMNSLLNNWPSLHTPIQKLILLNKRSIQDKYNKKIDSFPKQIWNFPHNHDIS